MGSSGHGVISRVRPRVPVRVMLAAAVALATLSLPASMSTASATATSVSVPVPLNGFGGMVVDGAHGHVFVSGGTGDSRVVVFDLVGNVVTTLTNEFGATAMLLDGSTLYIAQT